MANKGNEIRVYSEIGKLKKVLVHRPGDELKYVTPQRIDELLMSAIIELEQAQIEHDAFTQILKNT
jgi:arginine deiminase